MVRTIRWLVTLAGVAAGVAAGGPAQAVFIKGSFGFSQFGPTTVDNADFSLATSFTLPPNKATSPFVNIDGNFNFSSLTEGLVGTITPTTFSNSSTNTLVFGGFTFNILFGSLIPSLLDPNTLSYDGVGSVTAAGFDPSLFTINIAVVRNPGSSTVPEKINASGVISAPGQTSAVVPEPASLALAGVGAAGLLGLARRRRAAR